MQTADWIAAVGSGATALATVAAFITIYITVQLYRKGGEQQQAAQIRQSLQTLKNQSPILSTLLREGSILFFGASSIVQQLHSRLGFSPNRKEFWRYLGDDHHWLSIAIIGWYSSPQTKLSLDTISPMEQCISFLTGGLTIFSYPVQMLRAIIDDTCNPTMFYRLFSAMKETGTFFQQHKEEEDIDHLTDALTIELQDNLALYLVVKYADTLNQLNDFVTKLSDDLLNLEDSTLVKIAAITSKTAIGQHTRTASMEAFLKELRPYLSTTSYTTLLELTNEINKSVSVEAAKDRLDKTSKTNKVAISLTETAY